MRDLMDDPLLTVRDVCGQLKLSRTALRNLRIKGALQSLKLGRAVRFRRSDIDALVARAADQPR